MNAKNIEICVKIPCYSNKLRFVTINLNDINKNEFVKQCKSQAIFICSEFL